MKKTRCAVLSALLITVFAGCAWQNPAGGITVKRPTDLRVKGLRRTYELHLPDGYDPQQKVPLLVVVHGAFSTAKKMEQETRFSALADQYGFAVAYPNGMGIGGLLQHWNAGHCCGKAAEDGIDDVGFLNTIIDDIRSAFPIDNVYMTGFSNGGMLVHWFAAERGATLSGAAVVAGAMGGRASRADEFWKIPEPEVPVPMLIMHSRTDTHVPYNGGRSIKRANDEREYLSVDDAVQFWVMHNQCNKKATESEIAEAQIARRRWDGVSPVELCTLDDWPHVWPGPIFRDRGELNEFDASEVILHFFEIGGVKESNPPQDMQQ